MNLKPQSLIYQQRTWWIAEDATFNLPWVRVHNSVIRLITWHTTILKWRFFTTLAKTIAVAISYNPLPCHFLMKMFHTLYSAYNLKTEQNNRRPLDLNCLFFLNTQEIHLIKLLCCGGLFFHIVIIHPLRNIFLFCHHQYSTMEQLLRKVTQMCLPRSNNEVWHSWEFERSFRYLILRRLLR